MSLATAKDYLKLKSCTGAVRDIPSRSLGKEELETLLRETMTGDAVIVLWLMHGIVWGRWQGGALSLMPDEKIVPDEALVSEYWQELRVFNETEELHLRRVGDAFAGRYRKDEGESGPYVYVDSFSRFWGERKSAEGGCVTLADSLRKLSLVIPAEGDARWYGLQTRNYVGSDDETGLSGYVDYRFVHIASAEEGQ